MKKLKLEVKIIEIDVTEEWYEIHYEYSIDGKTWESDMYDNDFENWSISEWRKELNDGEAMKQVLEKIVENIQI